MKKRLLINNLIICKLKMNKVIISYLAFAGLSLMFQPLNAIVPPGLPLSTFISTTSIDETPPVAICSNISISLDQNGIASITAYDVDNGSYLESGGTLIISINQENFTCDDVGENEVVLTVEDFDSGLLSVCTATVTVADTIPPVALCKDFTLNLVNGTGTVMPSDIDNGSYDNCNLTYSVSPNTFTCSDVGVNEVTFTVTDGGGNTASCTAMVTVQYEPECSITAIASEGSETGSPPTTIYLGYGPQNVTLQGSATGGSGFTYSWGPASGLNCTTCQDPLFTPTEEGLYTFTMTVTNSSGCSNSCEITICVLDIRVPGSNGKRVYLCHALPNGSGITMGLPIAVVPQHIPDHAGDHLGACDQSCDGLKTGSAPELSNDFIHAENASFETILYPNPFQNDLTIAIHSHSENNCEIIIYDITGRQIEKISGIIPGETIKIGQYLENGLYFIHVRQNGQVQKIKAVKAN